MACSIQRRVAWSRLWVTMIRTRVDPAQPKAWNRAFAGSALGSAQWHPAGIRGHEGCCLIRIPSSSRSLSGMLCRSLFSPQDCSSVAGGGDPRSGRHPRKCVRQRLAPRPGCSWQPYTRGPLAGSKGERIETGGVALLHPRLLKITPLGVQEKSQFTHESHTSSVSERLGVRPDPDQPDGADRVADAVADGQ